MRGWLAAGVALAESACHAPWFAGGCTDGPVDACAGRNRSREGADAGECAAEAERRTERADPVLARLQNCVRNGYWTGGGDLSSNGAGGVIEDGRRVARAGSL